MKIITVSLADIEGVPHGSASANTNVKVTARYTSAVVLADGRIIPQAVKGKQLANTGVREFEVYASDDPAIAVESQGFAIRFEAHVSNVRGEKGVTYTRTVKPLMATTSPASLGKLAAAEPVPAKWVSVADFAADLTATAEQASAAAQSAQADASQSAADADAALVLTQQAQAAALEIPDANTAAMIGNPATETSAAFVEKAATIALGVRADSFRASTAGGDKTAELAAFLNDPTLTGKRRLIGDFTLTDKVTAPAGAWVDAARATLIQSGNSKAMLSIGTNARVRGLRLIGKTTDYVPGEGSFSTASRGIEINGDDVLIEDVYCEGIASAGIYQITGNRTQIHGVRIVGVNGKSGIAIPAQDAACMGIYLADGADATVTDYRVAGVSMGLISSQTTPGLTVRGVRATDVVGQHVLYLQHPTRMTVSDVISTGHHIHVVKVQVHQLSGGTNPGPYSGLSISDVTGIGGTDAVVMIANSDANLTTSTARIRNARVRGVTAVGSARLIYVGSTRDAHISGLVGRDLTSDAITVIDAQDTTVQGVTVDGGGATGVQFLSKTGSSTQRVTIDGADFRNVGRVARPYAVWVNDASAQDVTLRSINATSTEGLTQHGLLWSAGDVRSAKFRSNRASGMTGQEWRFAAATTSPPAEWKDMPGRTLNLTGTLPLPTASAGALTTYTATALPTSGVYVAGDTIRNSAPTPGGVVEWVITTPGGMHSGVWAASTAYALGTFVRTAAGRILEVTTAGTSGASEPTVPAFGATVTDGSVVWTYRATGPATAKVSVTAAT